MIYFDEKVKLLGDSDYHFNSEKVEFLRFFYQKS